MQEDEVGSQELLTPGATNAYIQDLENQKTKSKLDLRSLLGIKINIIYFDFNDKVVAGTMYEFDLVLDHAEESAAE